MELRHLRYFEAVARLGNFSRAADELGVAQPPLSRQIAALESELHVTLLSRAGRPIRLTEAGRVCYEQTVQILASVEQMSAGMRQLGAGKPHRFVIGVVGSIMQGALPEMLRRFRQCCPGIEVELIELITLEQIAALKSGRIDAGLGRVRIDDAAIRREVLWNEPLVAVVSARNAAADMARPIALADLVLQPLIVYPSQPRPSYADQVLTLLRDHGHRPAKIIEVREIQTAIGLVAAEAGVTIVPSSMRHIQRDDIRYRPIAQSDACSPVILSLRHDDATHESALFAQIGQALFGGTTWPNADDDTATGQPPALA